MFDIHINNLYKKAVRQINVFYQSKGIFNFFKIENNSTIHLSCLIVIIVQLFGTFVEKYLQFHEQALRFMLRDQISTYEQIPEKCNYTTLHIRRLRIISHRK